MTLSIKKLLLLRHIKVHNANALSSPYTIGFPAMTAWLGAAHALQRKLNANGVQVNFDGVGVVSHDLDLQTYRGDNDFVSSIVGTGNPLDKTGARSAFIEEARCHLDVSLVIEYTGIDIDEEDEFREQVSHILNANMKMAGGDIQDFLPPETTRIDDYDTDEIRKVTRKLMPGYALIERRDLMMAHMQQQFEVNGKVDAIDAMLDFLAVHHRSEQDADGQVTWRSERLSWQGEPIAWVVPIATGFQGISELGEAKNQRDSETPHRFAESIVTLGEFKMPYRFDRIEALLWRYHFDEENNLYICQQSAQIGNADIIDHDFDESIESEFD